MRRRARYWSGWLALALASTLPARASSAERPDPHALLREPLAAELDSLDPLFRDTTIDATIRSAYFRLDNEGKPLSQNLALGGNLLLQTGWWRDTIRFGLQPYFSEPIQAPAGEGGTLTLKDDQGAINVVGQAFLEARFGPHQLKTYRQVIDTPFINEHFDRMIPQLFEAYLVRADDWHRLSYVAGFVTREKTRESSSFRTMSDVAGATDTDDGVALVGGEYALTKDLTASLYEYAGVNLFNTLYLEVDWDVDLGRFLPSLAGFEAKLAAQYSNQEGIGTELIGSVQSNAGGFWAGLGWEGSNVSLRFTRNANSGTVLHPWARYPGFNKSTVKDFDLSGATTIGIWLSHDFGTEAPTLRIPRIPGLALATNLVAGQTPNTGSFATADEREYDIVVDYRFTQFESRWLTGLWLRVQISFVSFRDLPGKYVPAINDYRFIVNYDLPAVL